jgi:aldose 1-epimerase
MVSSSTGQGLEVTERVAGEAGGEPVRTYVLSNSAGTEVSVLNYAGIVQSVKFADRYGEADNIVLGFRTLGEYVRYNAARTAANPEGAGTYFGALIGRYANRIAGGRFRLEGQAYQVPVNNGGNSLHGGDVGFDQKVWAPTLTRGDGTVGLRLEYTSPAGEMGFPGTVAAVATYTLDNANRLSLLLEATTDAPTVVNLTNHTYWDLAGGHAGTIYDHVLQIDADAFTPVDGALIPTGEVRPVAGTPFDFREPTAIGEQIREEDPQLLIAWGYDHNWALNGAGSGSLRPVATVFDPKSGRGLRVHTTQPGLQFYSGNFLNGSLAGSGGRNYRQSDGFALETQHFPDAPNHPEFASTELRPGEKYSETTVFELFCET